MRAGASALSFKWFCPDCEELYESPIKLLSVSHRCPKRKFKEKQEGVEFEQRESDT